ncbi:precorrin-2 C(20)-methyltransferase [Hippea alviniae]|uniref:precorrin-2 C(20)-methyltransferase n=1 Tax=Hippea alviniae TaxID=1279027 RepID=UPI0003B49500|nr:precorrin-2 C(20)-methyltransferase [Hippea alviniae]
MLYVIGVGVGKPEFLTLEALEKLRKSDIVIVPKSKKSSRSVAFNVIKDFVDKDKIQFFSFPTTNDKDELKRAYDSQALMIEKLLNEGKTVSYTTIGDVSIYSTFNYLSERLKDLGIYFEIIPGIPSFVAFADRIKIPLSLKDESFAVVEMKKGVGHIVKLFEYFDTVVIMKVNNRIDELLEIVEMVKPKDAWLGKNLFLEKEEIVDLNKTDKINEAYLSLAVLRR